MSLWRDKKILVLVVDIDNDLGEAGIKAPLIGYEEVFKGALDFALKKPSDSDVNAIFYALSLYKKLKNEGADIEIAILTGEKGSSLKSALKISRELEELKKHIGFTHILFVSDGMSDEQVIPVISSISPIIGVERVVVEQSRGIEETYILLGRYIRKAFTEQPYARIFLGIPGLLIIISIAISVIGLSQYIWDIILLTIGSYFFIKGFGIWDLIVISWRKSPIIGIMYFISISLLAYVVIGVGMIFYYYGSSLNSIINAIDLSILPLMISFILLFGGRVFGKVIDKMYHMIWKDSIAFLPVILSIIFLRNLQLQLYSFKYSGKSISFYNVLYNTGLAIQLIMIIVISISVAVLFIIIDILSKRRGSI
jgi:putative membrane protein